MDQARLTQRDALQDVVQEQLRELAREHGPHAETLAAVLITVNQMVMLAAMQGAGQEDGEGTLYEQQQDRALIAIATRIAEALGLSIEATLAAAGVHAAVMQAVGRLNGFEMQRSGQR